MITFYIFLITCVFAVIGYLLGSILFSVIISELANKDVRYLGSKNPGSTNIARILGIKIGFVNAILDAVKGYVAVIICLIIYRYSIAVWTNGNINLYGLIFVGGTFAVIGHCFPLVYLIHLLASKFDFKNCVKYQGGKGVSTSGGVFFAISPWIALVAFGIWLLIVSSTRYVSLGSIITLAISPPLVYAPHLTLWYLINNHIFGPSNFHISILFITCIFILTMVNGLLVTYRHRTNIIRLLHHKENRFGKHHDKKD